VKIYLPIPPQVYPGEKALERLSALSPKERREVVGRWRRERLGRLLRALGDVEYELNGSARNPYGIKLSVEARAIPRVRSSVYADTIWVTAVEGRKRRRLEVSTSGLYAVKGLLVEKTEGEAKGREQVEERLLVLRAKSEREAVRLARRMFKASESWILLTDGRYQKSRFEEILDVCECPDRDFNPKGTEVFYAFRNRKRRPSDAWYPGRR